jgi:hypothetical protein
MSFPNKGRKFPGAGNSANGPGSGRLVAEAIAQALRRELGHSHAAVKTVAQWTGASDRAAKNWLAGRYAPSGEHLVTLVGRSDEVLFAFLLLAHRHEIAAAAAVVGVRMRLRRTLEVLDRILEDDQRPLSSN